MKISEHQHLIRCDRPLGQQIHVAGLHSFNEAFWLEPASL
jgi:hypothetical protein